jgi:hypothetical protein
MAAGVLSLLLILVGIGIGALLWSSGAANAKPNALADVALRGRSQRAGHHPRTSYLFTLDAHSGTLTPEGGGRYRLELSKMHSSALYFTDRPVRQVGTLDPRRLFTGLLRSDRDPPNLAINALNPKTGHQDVMGVTLLSARYDAAAHTARLEVKALPQGPQSTREHNLTDVVLPAKFGHTSLFIDDSVRHTCTVSIMNMTAIPMSETSASTWDTDSWSNNIVPDSTWTLGVSDWPTVEYASEGGSFRGCGNSTSWSGTAPDGSDTLDVTISVSDPWSGSNQYSCDVVSTSGAGFRCGLDSASESIGGDDLNVIVDICSTGQQYSWVPPGSGSGLECQDIADGMNWLD